MLQSGLKEEGYNVKMNVKPVQSCLIKVMAIISKDAAAVVPNLDRPTFNYDNSPAKDVLGINFERTAKEFITECGIAQIKLGKVKNVSYIEKA